MISGGFQSQGSGGRGNMALGARQGEFDILGSVSGFTNNNVTDGRGTTIPCSGDEAASVFGKIGWSPGFNRFELSAMRFQDNHPIPIAANTATTTSPTDRETVQETLTFLWNYANPAQPLLEPQVVVYRTHVSIDEQRLRVAEVVALGRLPWHGTLMMARDAAAVEAALAEAGIAHLAQRSQATLSGGEKQRLHLARALAQPDGAASPAFLLLDEPTASLDVKHSAALLALLRKRARRGLAVLVVLHDLNEAAYVADRVAMLEGGRMAALGPAAQVLQPALLQQVYGVPFRAMAGALLPCFSA